MTEKLLRPLRTRPWPERWLTRVLGAALSCAAYLVCLPWDLRNRPETPGSTVETTPVNGTGVLALAAVLVLLAVHFGLRDALAWPLLLVAAPPAALLHVSLRTHPAAPDGFADVWPLTWAAVTLLGAAAVLVVASVARQFRADLADAVEEEWALAADRG
ncbi:hypothetical protein [Streptomyces rhizosphaerihabitans]|uniref:hypothetical protein n=1 Tax=Streptomyces rhizosphaerihabitans TaxID=1266770 RepID=UPI0021BF9123|nr:hypothetical protein [Streptomyces rhizosphaerihabitans]MCT9005242.1 hypothetical protein [Streptomyces rhizosphaerihabitans]